MPETRLSIAHVLPGMNFGGVEVAILKSYQSLNQEFDYKVYFVRDRGELDVGQCSAVTLFKTILNSDKRPDLILTSLWWGHLVGMVLSLFGVRWACFIHSTGYSSILDKMITKLSLTLCENHIFDSDTSKNYFSSYKNRQSFVVPYVFFDIERNNELNKDPAFTFSWIGRNSEEKRLDLLVKFITSLQEKLISFRCHICIAGERDAALDRLALDYKKSIVVQYNVPPENIDAVNFNSKMALCLSDYEGFSVTTAEATLRGNFICARKVGELSHYLSDKSTIWLNDLSQSSWEEFIKKVTDCIGNEEDVLERRIESQKHATRILKKKSYIYSLSTGLRDLCDTH